MRAGAGAGGSASAGPPQDNKEAAVGDAMKERIAWALRIYKDAAAGHGGEGGALAWDRDRPVLATRG